MWGGGGGVLDREGSWVFASIALAVAWTSVYLTVHTIDWFP